VQAASNLWQKENHRAAASDCGVLPSARLVLIQPGTRRRSGAPSAQEDTTMLWTLAVVFLVLWAMGFVAFHVTTGFIHLLLLAALVVVAFQLISGRRTV
jgi:hypothetical protein